MKKSLLNMNVILTGASSGIGRCTALALAREGCNLILAARRELNLEEVAQECERLGVRALAFKTDVTQLDHVSNLFEFALAQLGSVDIWINNAGVGAMGEFTKTPIEVHERVIKTNLLGQIYGAYVVIPYFKERGKGSLINNISLGGFVPTPYATAYSASKFGLRGFAESLRYELTAYPHVHICDVFPAFIDTPGFIHGANYTGKELMPSRPVYDPNKVANSIISLCKRPRAQVMVGNSGRVAKIMHTLTPKLMGSMLARITQSYFKVARETELTEGNLFRPLWRGAGTHGGWRLKRLPFSGKSRESS